MNPEVQQEASEIINSSIESNMKQYEDGTFHADLDVI